MAHEVSMPAALIADPTRPWSPYAMTTKAYKRCIGCGESTERPGPARWWWRPVPPNTPGFATGRAGESLCASCAEARDLSP